MTVQTKKFIDLSDIIALRFDCASCGASVSVGISRDVQMSAVQNCPNCNAGWAKLSEGQSISPSLKNFTEGIVNLKRVLDQIGKGGFSLSVEVKED